MWFSETLNGVELIKLWNLKKRNAQIGKGIYNEENKKGYEKIQRFRGSICMTVCLRL